VADVVVLAGALLILMSAIGVVRFSDVLARMHALSKASTLGVTIALLGAAVALPRLDDVMSLLLATALQTATNPVAATLLTQATYYAEGIPTSIDVVDELAEHCTAEPP
jgi:multicomponent Na+:H+ antiporter subunit G